MNYEIVQNEEMFVSYTKRVTKQNRHNSQTQCKKVNRAENRDRSDQPRIEQCSHRMESATMPLVVVAILSFSPFIPPPPFFLR